MKKKYKEGQGLSKWFNFRVNYSFMKLIETAHNLFNKRKDSEITKTKYVRTLIEDGCQKEINGENK